MSDTINYTININGNATDVLDRIGLRSGGATAKVDKLRTGLTKLGDCMFTLNNISSAFDTINQSITNTIQPGVDYNKSLTDLSAITNVTGKKLQDIGVYARQNAKVFGGSAAQGLESYKLILSKLGPEIANVPEALQAMGKNVSILSKTMGGDTVAAADVLTTAMNQFQVSLDDPAKASKVMTDMMNVMAAAAQAGSAELPEIKAALEQSGMAAKNAGVSFEEANAAIQVLDKAGKRGAEGGIALRNALSIMGEGRFMPEKTQSALKTAGIDVNALGNKSLTLADRLRLLQPVMNDTALMSQIFGRENANAGIALLAGVGQIDEYTAAITNTNSAQEQAQIVMGSYQEKMNRLKARFDDLKISFFNMSKDVLPGLQAAFYGLQSITVVGTVINSIACIGETALGKAIATRTKKMWQAVTAQWALVSSGGTWMGAAFTLAGVNLLVAASFKAIGKAIYGIPIIGWIAAGISLLIGVFTLLWNKSEKFRQVVFGVWEVVKAVFYNIGVVITTLWDNIIKPYFTFIYDLWKTIINGIIDVATWLWDGIVGVFTSIIQGIVSAWNWITGIFGGVAGWLDTNLLSPIKGVFSSVWDFVSGIFEDILGALGAIVEPIKILWNKIFPKDKFKDINVAYKVGVEKGSESWANDHPGKGSDGSLIGGIAGVKLPGLDLSEETKGKPKPPAATADAISSGGTRNSTIQITFKNMVENIVFDGSLATKRADLEAEIKSVMSRVLGMAQSTA